MASIPVPDHSADDGTAPPPLMAALEALHRGRGSSEAVLGELSGARLLVPVVAMLDAAHEPSDGGLRTEKQSSMAAVVAESREHGRALLAFTSTESMGAWRSDARPVALAAPLAARAARTEDADALVVDVGGPYPFAVAGSDLLLLAAVARAPGDASNDPVLRDAIARVVRHGSSDDLVIEPGTEGRPATLRLPPASRPDRQTILQAIAEDRVVRRLLPGGLRVVFGDTPPA
jgi:hypothetical protein